VPQGSVNSGFGGGVTTTVTYQDVGVILTVAPHINPDGFVYMDIEPEISQITDSTIQIAPGSFAPIIDRRKASTAVAVRDGETVVIGGLIRTSENEAETKVPFLGDIPGLGLLFRTTIRTKSKIELLIAMTPHVIRTVEDARRLSIEKRDESGIITPNMKQSPLMEKLRVTPESESEWLGPEEAPPTEEPGGQPLPVQPMQEEGPEPDQKPKYGPQPPKYGPLAPPDEDLVVRRTADGQGRYTGVSP
jgi:type II secretory pathway component GspD/PulD (secretin)